ncbi:MAG: hypothetical protein K2N24_06120 [Lachnospiraceae bacterium]|nr:hypothetical protein [Lachnospiraceae bacterium]
MKNLYGLFSLAGFMGTMTVYAVLGMEVSKLNLTITFLFWLALEGMIVGIRQLLRQLTCNKKWTGIKPPAHFTIL